MQKKSALTEQLDKSGDQEICFELTKSRRRPRSKKGRKDKGDGFLSDDEGPLSPTQDAVYRQNKEKLDGL